MIGPRDVTSLEIACLVCAALAASCWLLSVATREHSWVDRIWSIAPPAYVALFAQLEGAWTARVGLMLALSAIWGARLTYNFARKGGYARGGEDYRWEALKARMSPAAFAAFNLGFIAAFQNALLLAIALPAWVAASAREVPLGALDVVATLAFLSFLAGETIADQQQWAFQEDKRRRKERGEEVRARFLTTGLFRYSRHPNFFCEQALWWAFWLFGVAATGEWLHWSLGGAVVLTLLFQGSTTFTEQITLSRYPEYADYQRRTSRLLPLPPR